ncbi:arginyl-tRNA synthetase [Mycoplasma ovis str. Michigan]|uniref:arginine--tRNA ligase n=1 Tax=Mycoplasma ovis str. Michigan TaxID=1415773 RepID=A0ABN4BL52_9MOLU|nr:arginine--tRNA ligase [Mycoplasma ovis]AHC40033.1 arginyl-tRNA synthetase [Mycoplasma ovis str. Michigan]
MIPKLSEKIGENLTKILKNNDWILLLDKVVVEGTNNSKFGFLNTNLPYLISSVYKKSLEDLEERLISSWKEVNDLSEIERVELNRGYLNFYPSADLIRDFYINSSKNKKIIFDANNSVNELQKYFVEIISANPTGELHIGHIRNGVITDSLSNLLEYNGNSVYRAYLVNDSGTQIKELVESLHLIHKHMSNGTIMTEIPKYYSEIIENCVREICNKFGSQWDLDNKELTKEIRNFSIEYLLGSIKKELKELSIQVDSWDHESQICTESALSFLINKLKEHIYINEKALWFNTSKFSNDLNKDDVIVKKDGSITYFGQDLIYHLKKLDFLGSNGKIVNVLAQDHSSHITRMKAFFKSIGVPEEMVQYKTTQLSRLLIEGKKVVLSKRDNVYLNLAELKEHLSLDEIRWLLSSRDEESELDIDISKLKERNYNNPIFYILYAFSRASSLVELINLEPRKSNLNFKILNSPKELDLIYAILSIELHFKKAVDNLKTSIIASYLINLAQKFHAFYEAFSIRNDSNLETKLSRFTLVKLVHRIFSELLPIFRIQPRKLS